MLEAGPVPECDTLAQPLREGMGPVPAVADGVSLGSIRWPMARAACATPMKEYLGEAGFVAYAVRAADKAGDALEAARRRVATGGRRVGKRYRDW